MSKKAKVLVGIAMAWPLIFAAGTIILSELNLFSNGAALLWALLSVLSFLASVWGIVVGAVHVFRKATGRLNEFWGWGMILLGPLILPIFWYRFIWREGQNNK